MKTYEVFTEHFSKIIQAENMNFAFQKYAEQAEDPEDMDIIAIIEHERGYMDFLVNGYDETNRRP